MKERFFCFVVVSFVLMLVLANGCAQPACGVQFTECKTDGDCGTAEYCRKSEPTKLSCRSEETSTSICYPKFECSSNTDCNGEQVCFDDGKQKYCREQKGCSSDSDCGEKQYCHKEATRCGGTSATGTCKDGARDKEVAKPDPNHQCETDNDCKSGEQCKEVKLTCTKIQRMCVAKG